MDQLQRIPGFSSFSRLNFVGNLQEIGTSYCNAFKMFPRVGAEVLVAPDGFPAQLVCDKAFGCF